MISTPYAQVVSTSGSRVRDRLQRLLRVQVLRLDERDPELGRQHRDGRRRELLAAAALGVGPRDDELRTVRGIGERLQHDRRELGGAEVDVSQAVEGFELLAEGAHGLLALVT